MDPGGPAEGIHACVHGMKLNCACHAQARHLKLWQAKTQAECYDYLFEAAIKMRQIGLDASMPPPPSGSKRNLQSARLAPLNAVCDVHDGVVSADVPMPYSL